MRRRPHSGDTTRQRSVSLSDREWAEIGRRADRHRVSRSRFIADHVLTPPQGGNQDNTVANTLATYQMVLTKLNALQTIILETESTIDLIVLLTAFDRVDRRLAFLAGGLVE